MVSRVCALFDPPLVIPDSDALDALVDELDAHGDERDMFRRARGAMAAQLLRRGEYEESLYEALHAHPAITSDAITEARATLLTCSFRRDSGSPHVDPLLVAQCDPAGLSKHDLVRAGTDGDRGEPRRAVDKPQLEVEIA
jgi:hypothetical protein